MRHIETEYRLDGDIGKVFIDTLIVQFGAYQVAGLDVILKVQEINQELDALVKCIQLVGFKMLIDLVQELAKI